MEATAENAHLPSMYNRIKDGRKRRVPSRFADGIEGDQPRICRKEGRKQNRRRKRTGRESDRIVPREDSVEADSLAKRRGKRGKTRVQAEEEEEVKVKSGKEKTKRRKPKKMVQAEDPKAKVDRTYAAPSKGPDLWATSEASMLAATPLYPRRTNVHISQGGYARAMLLRFPLHNTQLSPWDSSRPELLQIEFQGHTFPVEPLVKTCSAALPLCLFFTGHRLVASLTSVNESPFCHLIEKSCQSLLIGVFRIETIERERLEGEKEKFHLVLRWMEDKHPWYAPTAPAFEAQVFAHPLFNEAPCTSFSVGSPAAHLFIAIVCQRCRCTIDRLDWIGWKCLRCQITYQARQLTIERDVPFGRLPITYTGPRLDNGKAAVDLTRFSRELYVWSDHVKSVTYSSRIGKGVRPSTNHLLSSAHLSSMADMLLPKLLTLSMPFRRAELSSSLPNAFLAAFRAADALGNPSKLPLPYHQPTDVIACPPPHAVCQLVEHVNVNIERFVEEEENLAIFNEVTLCVTTEARLCVPEQQIDKEDLVAPHHAWAYLGSTASLQILPKLVDSGSKENAASRKFSGAATLTLHHGDMVYFPNWLAFQEQYKIIVTTKALGIFAICRHVIPLPES